MAFAREFNNDVNTNWLENTSLAGLSYPCTFGCWYYFIGEDATPDYMAIMNTYSGVSSGVGIRLHMRIDGSASSTHTAAMTCWDGSTNNNLSHLSTTATDGGWLYLTGTVDSSGYPTVYVNNTAGTKDTTYASPDVSGASQGFGVGHMHRGASIQWDADAHIGQPCIWNVELTAGEIASLVSGVSPLKVRPGNIVAYWPMTNDTANGSSLDVMTNQYTLVDQGGGTGLTTIQQPGIYTHLSSQRHINFPSTAPPAGTVPLLSHPHRHTNLGFG